MSDPGALPIDRWVVKGKIRNLAPLAIRTGDTEVVKVDDKVTGEPALVASDYLGAPYLPATAIKGLARALAAARLTADDLEAVRRLFGDMPRGEPGSTSQQARGGSAEFRDAFITDAAVGKAAIFTRGQTSIDRQYGTAEHARLRQGQYVAENQTFDVEIIVDRATDRVLGCHMVDVDAPEIIQGISIALKAGATKAQFDATVGIHPTAAEEFVTTHKKLSDDD